MTRYSASRGILYRTPPGPDRDDSATEEETAMTDTDATEAAADD